MHAHHTEHRESTATSQLPTLVVGATGKTGRRVTERLVALGRPVRIGSRWGAPPFDWERPDTWAPALQDVGAVYLTYYPDLAVPGAVDAIDAFTTLAVRSGVRQVVLLSGRGEEAAGEAEAVVRKAPVDWTVLRASWFAQNFSEGYLVDAVLAGHVALPAGEVAEPFVDADDIADVAVAALTEPGHAGRTYELTGPRLLTFAQAVAEIAAASGREIRYEAVTPDANAAALRAAGMPEEVVWLMTYLFTTVLDGRNASVTDGVRQALGRAPRDFADYARAAAAAGAWSEWSPMRATHDAA